MTGRIANSFVDENVGMGLVAGSGVTFESVGNSFVRGNFGGDIGGAGLVSVIGSH